VSGQAKIRPAHDAVLLPYQARWVRDDARLKIAEKSRQIGWTWTAAYRVVTRKCLNRGRKVDAWISSRDEIQARLFLEDCRSFIETFDLGSGETGETALELNGATAFVLKLGSGMAIHSMSSNPDAQAGKRGDRILDEFALHEDPRKLYAIAYPGITWGGSLEIFSTHRGSRNFFNELITEIKHKGNPKGFSLHSVTLQQALEEGLLYKLQGKLPADDARQEMDEAAYFDFIRSGCADEESFQEEFCCQPGDDNAAFLSYDLMASCEYAAGEDWAGGAGGARYVGVDIGRDHDLTVIWEVEKIGDVRFTRKVVTLDRQSFDAQESVLYGILDNPAVKRCGIDQTGMGRQFAERAQRRYGAQRVEGIHFTAAVKEELAYGVRAALESRTVRLPGDKLIRADLRSMRKETTAAGNIRFTGERTRHGHADRFWALALALHAAKGSGEAQYFAQVI
jgi:phage FluMu gp28-like protein